MYLTYDEYIEKGGTLDKSAFSRHLRRAEAEVDTATYKRVSHMSEVPDAVKNCLTEIIDTLGQQELQQQMQGSNDGVSVTFTQRNFADEIGLSISRYLSFIEDDKGTPLLYMGVD